MAFESYWTLSTPQIVFFAWKSICMIYKLPEKHLLAGLFLRTPYFLLRQSSVCLLSNEKKHWLFSVHRGLYYTVFFGIITNHGIRIPFLNNQDSVESSFFFCVALLFFYFYVTLSTLKNPKCAECPCVAQTFFTWAIQGAELVTWWLRMGDCWVPRYKLSDP